MVDVAQQARVTVDAPDDLPAAVADPGLLERVVENLVSNALRHAPGPVGVNAAPGVALEEPRGE